MDVKYNHKGDRLYFHNCFPMKENEYFYVDMAGYTFPRPTYRISRTAPHANRMYVIEYVLEGRGHIEYDAKTYTVTAGDFYILNTDFPHTYYADAKEPFGKIWINVSGRFMDGIVEAFGFDPVTICRINVEKEINDIHEILKKIYASEIYDVTEELTVMIYRLLFKVYSGRNKRYSDNERFEKLSNYIMNNITSGISVKKICDDNYISRTSLYRLFKKNAGISPDEYIQRLKIRIAARILRETDIELDDIVSQLGYYDYSHFCKSFTKIKGMTPVQFRKSKQHPGG